MPGGSDQADVLPWLGVDRLSITFDADVSVAAGDLRVYGSNVREYAQATQVKITLDMDDNLVRATVEDNGRGFDPAGLQAKDGEGRGLLALRDRVSLAGGSLEFNSEAGKGSRIVVAIPTEA